MTEKGLGVHESLELHEILAFKNVCCTKSATMNPLVSDSDLKQIMQRDVEKTKNQIKELQQVLTRVNEEV